MCYYLRGGARKVEFLGTCALHQGSASDMLPLHQVVRPPPCPRPTNRHGGQSMDGPVRPEGSSDDAFAVDGLMLEQPLIVWGLRYWDGVSWLSK